jgi:hypothetical protein
MGRADVDFYWKATFTDGTLEEFDEKDTVSLFKDVEKRKEDLTKFELIDPNGKESYTVDLVNKRILGPGITYSVTGSNPELIYFKRNSVRAEVGTGKILESSCVYHLGIKTSTQERKLEIFKGQGQKPKKVEYNDVKAVKKIDLTSSIEKEIKE